MILNALLQYTLIWFIKVSTELTFITDNDFDSVIMDNSTFSITIISHMTMSITRQEELIRINQRVTAGLDVIDVILVIVSIFAHSIIAQSVVVVRMIFIA